MPVHTVHNVQTTISAAVSFCVCLSLWFASPVEAQDADAAPSTQEQPAADAETYQSQQREKVQAIRRINDSLVTPELLDKFTKTERRYKQILGSGARTQTDRDTLKAGLQYRIYILADSDIQRDLKLLGAEFQKVQREIGGSGRALLNNSEKQRLRQLVCDEAVAAAEKLLESNLIARSLACELLLAMEVVSSTGGARIQMHDRVARIYESILADPNQPDAVKTRAANCVKKYLQKARAFPQVEMALASVLASELRRPFTEVAYQDTILAALENIKASRQLVGKKKPLHLEVAVQIMRDRTRDILIRCRCARVLGRAAFDAQIKFDPLAWTVAELALETGLRFNQAKANAKDPRWRRSGWYLYTAFHHENKKEIPAKKGFLNRDGRSALVKGAYDNSIKIMAHLMFNRGGIAPAHFGTLDNWLKKNLPKSWKWDPTCEPIKGPAAAQPQNGG